jgi:ferredoxin-type protein NapG
MAGDRPISRRDLLRGRFSGSAPPAPLRNAASAPVGRRFTLPIHRPPGAVEEAVFLAGCTRCKACMSACPVGAIVHAPERFREAADTPMIDPYSAACVMCADTPCIAACEPAVLRPDRSRKMGVAWIQPMACLAHTGSFCTVCAERCPVPGAVEVTMGKPRILADICTGCGTCAAVCPAPTNAVVVMPLADRLPAHPEPPATAS